MNIQDILASHRIIPDPLQDQFFLVNDDVVKKMAEAASLTSKDVVLEIGTGLGNLTRVLASQAGQVIAFEIDQKFKLLLSDLPGNVEIHFEDAWEYVQLDGKYKKKKQYNKVVANLPFSFAEKFLHNLTFLEYDKVILLIPLGLVNKIIKHPVFGSFFKVKKLFLVNKINFYPIPKTNSVVIDLIKLPDPVQTKNLTLFLRQFIYQHEETKLKNSLREGLIKYTWLVDQKRLTKKKAKEILEKLGLDEKLLEQDAVNGAYLVISQKFSSLV